ncbi:hypothetical protein DXG01_008500 [Tephrocybe rancida]|nr:hypothetical protein DXG01_008500 [Tephrocybe rancida]
MKEKILYVFDPKALQHIIVKDQDIFEETAPFIDGNKVLWGDGLLSTLGESHRKQRKMLNPVFSVTHVREMMPVFYDVTHKACKHLLHDSSSTILTYFTRQLTAAIERELLSGSQEVDIHHWMSRGALELIGRSGLGHSLDSLTEGEKPHPYGVSVKELIPLVFTMTFVRIYLLGTLLKIGTPKFRRSVVDNVLAPLWKNARRLRDIIDVMHNTSVDIFNAKKRVLKEDYDVGKGKDIMSILSAFSLFYACLAMPYIPKSESQYGGDH